MGWCFIRRTWIIRNIEEEYTLTVHMKNWLPFVLGPAFAMLTTPGPVWDTGDIVDMSIINIYLQYQ